MKRVEADELKRVIEANNMKRVLYLNSDNRVSEIKLQTTAV